MISINYLWALPLINTLGMKVGLEKVFGAGSNVLPVWKKRLDAKTLVTTPNSDAIYVISYLDLGKDSQIGSGREGRGDEGDNKAAAVAIPRNFLI